MGALAVSHERGTPAGSRVWDERNLLWTSEVRISTTFSPTTNDLTTLTCGSTANAFTTNDHTTVTF
jgi:hypothetical protein